MTAAEWGVLLLCCALPGEEKPLSLPQFQELGRRARALGCRGDDPLRELTAQDLASLGYDAAQSARITRLLAREAQLEQYLRAAAAQGITAVTRLSSQYPARLRHTLGPRCPAVLFAKGEAELSYLASVLDELSRVESERDIQEIRQELTDTGYLRRPSKAKGREKRVVSKPMEFRSSAGLRISVGKNNTQNDLLTCKQAFKSDIWFHTQKIHGSHVILWTEGRAPDLQSLNEAACLAAWFSQARGASRVPVDYTPIKYVKKPNGARPGMVTYTTYETAWVTPREELVKELRIR